MKKLLLLILLSIGIVSCVRETIPTFNFSDRFIELRPELGVRLRSTLHLTGVDIVKQAVNLSYYNDSLYGHQPILRGFAEGLRDTIKPCLKMFSTDIIHDDGTYASNFVEGTDCVIPRLLLYDRLLLDTIIYDPINNIPSLSTEYELILDTIAYIPNSVLKEAAINIKIALEEKNYTRCYELFDSAFTFRPITGKEWLVLKLLNKE